MAKLCPTCNREFGDADLYCPADGSTLQSERPGDDLIGTVVADRYLITDAIGEGGMGRVYLARHVRLPQNVAIKVLHPGLVRDPSVVARFRREAINASQIENEHVARVFDHGEVGDGLFYIAMEFVEGEPLSRIIAREGALPPPRAVEIARQVADALAAAHERPTPIVHRDLKPDNIMVGTRRDGTDRVKVVDFGIAEAMSGGGPKLTQQGLVIGTPEYMSPEQLSAITLDWRSDIYSLALVTFDMLTGRLPFPSDSPHEAALMRLRDRPRTLAEMKGDVAWPPALQAVIDCALARAPGDRYETAPAFARALMDAIGSGAVAAAAPVAPAPVAPAPVAPAPVDQAPAPTPRHANRRARTAAIGSAVALAVVALVAIGVLAWRARPASSTVAIADTSARQPTTDSVRRVDTSAASPTAAVTSPPDTSSVPRSAPPVIPAAPDRAAGTSPAVPGVRTPERPAAPAPGGARAALDRIETLIVRARADTVRGQALARAVLDSARAVVPRLEARDDIVELGVYTTAAYLLLGQKTDACLMLESIGAEAGAMVKFAAQVRLWNERLDCRD